MKRNVIKPVKLIYSLSSLPIWYLKNARKNVADFSFSLFSYHVIFITHHVTNNMVNYCNIHLHRSLIELPFLGLL